MRVSRVIKRFGEDSNINVQALAQIF